MIKARAGVFRACYQKELDRNPKLAGSLAITFEITTDGKAANVAIKKGTLDNDAVVQCVTANIDRLRFARADLKSRVRVSFVYSQSR